MNADVMNAMPGKIVCLVRQTTGFSQNNIDSSYTTLFLPGLSEQAPGKNVKYVFWVLNGVDPLQKPQTFVAENNITVPPGLDQLMTNQNILVAAINGPTHDVPQGPLYELLSNNGAGTALTTLENLNTYLACGVRSKFAYVLVSVPGPEVGPGGEEGIEFLELPIKLSQFNTLDQGLVAQSESLAPFDLILDNESGLYFPVRSINSYPANVSA